LRFKRNTTNSLVAAPSYTKLRTFFLKIYSLVRPIMERIMRSRYPGHCISTDATFAVRQTTRGAGD
jgi:hypothetical protein